MLSATSSFPDTSSKYSEHVRRNVSEKVSGNPDVRHSPPFPVSCGICSCLNILSKSSNSVQVCGSSSFLLLPLLKDIPGSYHIPVVESAEYPVIPASAEIPFPRRSATCFLSSASSFQDRTIRHIAGAVPLSALLIIR